MAQTSEKAGMVTREGKREGYKGMTLLYKTVSWLGDRRKEFGSSGVDLGGKKSSTSRNLEEKRGLSKDDSTGP